MTMSPTISPEQMSANGGGATAAANAIGSDSKSPQEVRATTSGRSQRTTISCFSCRHKKLKCDRARPCGNCVKRGLACAYAAPAERPPAHGRGGHAQLYSRIRHLEELLGTLVSERVPGSGSTGPDAPLSLEGSRGGASSSKASSDDEVGRAGGAATKDTPGSERDRRELAFRDFGYMRMNDDAEITYVSATHWAAIRENITSIREYIETEHERCDVSTKASFQGPSLLLGICTPSETTDILSSVPPRPVADRLVSRYFNSGEPSILIFHMPTFQQEYDRFWTDPQGTPITWLGLLFSIMCLGVFFHLRSSEETPGLSCSPEQATEIFRLRAVECLVLGNYTKPKAYTIESLLLHIQCEYFGSDTADNGVWVLWGMLIRLALYIGLHRDSRHFSEISCFEGEMRRRKWALIAQLDLLISYQAGLPRMIREGESDAELPHNLFDEDFHKASTELPPARSDAEMTPVSYSIYKGKVSQVFGLIADQASVVKAPSSSGAMDSLVELDRKLNEIYLCIPPHLQLRSLNRSVTDPPTLIMRRYTADILYHKACCLLHRKYFEMLPSTPQYRISRERCLASALQLLRHQATINQEVQPGGLLYKDKWFASSLTSFDFLLAAMVVCLELQHGERGRGDDMRTATDPEMTGHGEAKSHGKEELLHALQISHDLWSLAAPYSKDAANAFEACAVMLGRVNNIPSEEAAVAINPRMSVSSTVPLFATGSTASPEARIKSIRDDVPSRDPNPRIMDFSCPNGEEWIPVDHQETMFPLFNATGTGTSFVPGVPGNMHPGGAGGPEELDASIDINWRLWDHQMQNMGVSQPEWMSDRGF